jgi:hypothetical protein
MEQLIFLKQQTSTETIQQTKYAGTKLLIVTWMYASFKCIQFIQNYYLTNAN